MFTLPHRTTDTHRHRSAVAVRVPAFVARLREHGSQPAVVGRVELTYDELAGAVDSVAAQLASTERRLVHVAVRNDVHSLIGYLGALASGHVVLLAPVSDRSDDAVVETYRPDAFVRPSADGVAVRIEDAVAGRDLHPELALLLSTSGSTGSPKLVRLSVDNLDSNAAAIGDYLGIRSSDRAALTLPMHYCYGLSIVHSNLAAGAALMVDDRSVVDACFWDEFRRCGATSLSGVPHTFDLLDRVRFETLDLPTLRYVTQAGGRMAPEKVERFARLGQRSGWDLFVMYGQTEATARMAYLPPDLAASRPSAIGVPIAGGDLRIDTDGELVYRGPNVMLGYATAADDLGLGRTVDELRTGDIATRADDGLFEIVGRKSRFLKLYGLRIDLDRVERVLAAHDIEAVCAGDDDRIVVSTTAGASAVDRVRELVDGMVSLPANAVVVTALRAVPRLANGKVDYGSLLQVAANDSGGADDGGGSAHVAVANVFRRVLGVDDVARDDTFVDLGGDSLSYVEASIALEQRIGELPLGWPSMTVTELAALAELTDRAAPAAGGGRGRRIGDAVQGRAERGARWRLRTVETNVVLRAVAIVVIVGSHTSFMNVRGGAHVLLAVAGFNTARFHLARLGRSLADTLKGLASGAAHVAVPSAVWIGLWVAATDRYSLANVLFANSIVGPARWGERWQYWFLEVLLHVLVGLALLLCVPPVRRLVRDHGFAFACALTILGLALRYDALGVASAERLIHRADSVLWFFTLGWGAFLARSTKQRLLLTALLAAGIPHYFESGRRESYVTVGVLALIWVARVRLPAVVLPTVRVLAASSLYVYLTHWQLYPAVAEATSPLVALVASLAAGAGVWVAVEHVTAKLRPVRASVASAARSRALGVRRPGAPAQARLQAR